jgi:hypothetical protein
MWLELAAITLAMAIGFSVLALRVELVDHKPGVGSAPREAN